MHTNYLQILTQGVGPVVKPWYLSSQVQNVPRVINSLGPVATELCADFNWTPAREWWNWSRISLKLRILAYLLYHSAFSFEIFMASTSQSLELERQNGVA